MLRPPHHWKSFWAGILVLAFLGWAWVKSMDEGLMWTPRDESRVSLATVSGELGVILRPPSSYSMAGTIRSTPDKDLVPWFSSPFRSYAMAAESGIYVAYWLVTLLFFAFWFILLFVRWWRMHTKSRAKPSPSP